MKMNRGRKTIGFIKLICLSVLLASVFTLTSCNNSGPHSCIYSVNAVNSDTQNSFIANITNNEHLLTENQMMFYHLDIDFAATEKLKIPEGRFVGVCLGNGKKFDAQYEVIDANNDGTVGAGGIYTYTCGTHGIHSKNNFVYIEQNLIDMFSHSGASLYEILADRFPDSANNINVALRENVHISDTEINRSIFTVPADKTLNVCLNGFTFTSDFDMMANGGMLIQFNCQDPSYHECLHLMDNAVPINQSNFDVIFQLIASKDPGTYHAYLTSDISWDDVRSVSAGTEINVCLNGFNATGSVDNAQEKGKIYFFDCSHHLCQDICVSGEMFPINSNSAQWTLEYVVAKYANTSNPPTIYCVLEDDIDVPVIPGLNLRICLNGFKGRDDKYGQNGSVVYYNCASNHNCGVASLMQLSSTPIFSSSVEGVNEKIGSVGAGGPYLFNLTSDLEGTGTLTAPEGALVGICLDGFSLGNVTVDEGSNIFVYGCSTQYCNKAMKELTSFDQSAFDFLVAIGKMAYGSLSISADIQLTVSEDIVINADDVRIGDGYTVDICTCGHTVSGLDEVSGVVIHDECYVRSSKHSCGMSTILNSVGIEANSISLVENTADGINSVLAKLESGIYCYNLAYDLVGTGEITAPEGVVVAICRNGHSLDGVTVADGSNVFIFECGKHYCYGLNKTIHSFDQGAFDAFDFLLGGKPLYVAETTVIAISEDVTASFDITVADEAIFSICTCGHSFTALGNTEGVLTHNDNNLDSNNHNCYVAQMLSPLMSAAGVELQPLYACTVDECNDELAQLTNGSFAMYYLTSDILGTGTITVPEGCMVAVCLNGFSLGAAEIGNENSFFVYECGEQYCTHVQAYLPAFDQGAIDLIGYALCDDNKTVYYNTSIYMALLSDVTLNYNVNVADNCAMHVCTCGNSLDIAEGITAKNVYTHDDCIAEEDMYSTDGGIECIVCCRRDAKPLNSATLRDMIDYSGKVILAPGSYYYYLENDFQLSRALIIPDGVDLHICLHGHTLVSAYIWHDNSTFGGGYPEANALNIASVAAGAVFNVYDCSPDMSGEMTLRYFRTDKDGDGIRESVIMSVSDSDDTTTSFSEGIGAILAAILSNIVTNEGTVNIYGGNFNAITGFLNEPGGVINIYRGKVNTIFAGVLQTTLLSNDDDSIVSYSDSSVYFGENLVLNTGLVAVFAQGGDITVEGTVINSGMVGIASIPGVENNYGTLTINSVEINTGYDDVFFHNYDNVMSSLIGTSASFFTDEEKEKEFTQGLSSEINLYYGVVAPDSFNISGDVDITQGEMPAMTEGSAADVYFMGTSDVSIGQITGDTISILADESTVLGDTDAFEALQGCTMVTNAKGEIVIVPVTTVEGFASVTHMSVSAEGDVKINLYAEIDPTVVENVVFYITYGNDIITYTAADATIVELDGVSKYMFSIHTAAKDYADEVTYFFILTSSPNEKYSNSVDVRIAENAISVADYLDTIITDTADQYDEDTTLIAMAMKNYCASAANHFGTASGYSVVEGMEEYMALATKENLADLKPLREGDYEISPIVFKNATVILKTTTTIRIYYEVMDGAVVDSITVNGEYATLGVTADGRAFVEIAGVFAKDYFTGYEIVFKTADTSWTLYYSVASYAYSVIANPTYYTASAVDTCKAMVTYGYIAAQYYEKANSNPDEGGAE